MEKTPFYKQVASSIQNTFDLKTDTGGFPNIHWLIGKEMLKNESDFYQQKYLSMTVKKIKTCLHHAIRYLGGKGISIYTYIPSKGKKIIFLTNDPEYKKAKEKDYIRSARKVTQQVNSFGTNIKLRHEDKLPLLKKTKQLTVSVGKSMESKTSEDTTSKKGLTKKIK